MKNSLRKRKINFQGTAKRYARRVIADIKDDLLFGEELWDFIIASVEHDLAPTFRCQEMYEIIEDTILNIYEKNVFYCKCCRKYKYKDYIIKIGEKRICLECFERRNK